MAEKNPSVVKSALTAGVLLGLAIVVYSLILYFLDMSTNKYLGYVSWVIIIVGLVMLQIQYRDKELNGNMPYGKAFGFGILTLLFSTIITAVFSYVLFKFIDPGLIDKILGMQEAEMAKKGMTQEQIEMGIKMSKRFMSPAMMSVFALVGTMFIGTIITLVTSAFTRKDKTPFEA